MQGKNGKSFCDNINFIEIYSVIYNEKRNMPTIG